MVIERKQSALAAAQALLADYQTDPELTAFQALDGEDFLSRSGSQERFVQRLGKLSSDQISQIVKAVQIVTSAA